MVRLSLSLCVVSAGLTLVSTPVLAQVDMPECTPDVVRAAQAGVYTGPVCRFTNSALLQATTTTRSASHAVAHPSHTTLQDPASLPDDTGQVGDVITGDLTLPPLELSDLSANSANVSVDPVTLPDSFFTGALTGGVDRHDPVLFFYSRGQVMNARGEWLPVQSGYTIRQTRPRTAQLVRRTH